MDSSAIGTYPGDVEYKDSSLLVSNGKSAGSGYVFYCKIRGKLFSSEW